MKKAGQGAYCFLTIVATKIKQAIKNDDFNFIDLKVNEDKTAVITCQRDKEEPVLYKKELKYTDCPYSEIPYKFYFDCYPEQQTLILHFRMLAPHQSFYIRFQVLLTACSVSCPCAIWNTPNPNIGISNPLDNFTFSIY